MNAIWLKGPILIRLRWILALSWAALAIPTTAGVSDTSLAFFVNGPDAHDYGLLTVLPPSFGTGEFTLGLWIRPDNSFPVGPTCCADQLINWSNADEEPYSSNTWWFEGNFLLDGHNNDNFGLGTFSLQFYGGGRVRWLFGDGGEPGPGGHWSVGAFPATNAPSLLDGEWHQITLVRRWAGATSADLELWIDGVLIATETSTERADMRTFWDAWSGFPPGQEGWFFGAEKQAAIGVLSQYEDYKGPIDEFHFWDRARSAAEIVTNWNQPVAPGALGLVGSFRFNEGSGTTTCDDLAAGRCMNLFQMQPGYWSTATPPIVSIFADGFESGDLSAWSSSSQ